MRVKRRKKFASHARVRPAAAARVNDRWSMDFVADSLSDGRKIRVLTIIDSFTRECLALKIARSLPARSVTEALDAVIAKRGAPKTIQVDNGTESLTSRRGDQRDVRQKILNYQAYFRSGRHKRYEDVFHARFHGFRLLFLTTTPVRLASLCRLVARMPPSAFIWLTDQPSMCERGLAASIWKRGGQQSPDHSILGQALACPSPVLPQRHGRDACS